ncbi:ferrochelatase [Hydrocarboniphaga effusa]|uniref:ferrochelatase n=1 Tax=Hydrocarboniphaga effusa TaxID=243629 RepID=UPI003137C510
MTDPIDRPHADGPRTGVLLINLGTPEAPTPAAIRRYLRPFLSDRRVVELPRPLWLMVLYGFILPLRPRKLAHSYQSIWMKPGPEGSPLMHHSLRQKTLIREWLFANIGHEVPVALGMTYGEPSISGALDELESQGVRRVLVLPLYAQYSATSTAAALDAVFAALKPRRWLPELRTINSYQDHGPFIDALADSLRKHWKIHGRGDHLLMSFHSIPRQYFLAGDPYFCQCHKTARLLAEKLELAEGSWSVSFQSRLGRQPWLQPYTDLVVLQLARSGVRTLDVICPGFAADCLETLEEVALRYRDDFIAAGGASFRYVPALNADAPHIEALGQLLMQHLPGWLDLESADEPKRRSARAQAAQAQLHSPTLLTPPRAAQST